MYAFLASKSYLLNNRRVHMYSRKKHLFMRLSSARSVFFEGQIFVIRVRTERS